MATNINLSLTNDQFRSLLRLVYLGEWMANSHLENMQEKFHDATQLIYRTAGEAGFNDWLEHDPGQNEYYETMEFDSEMLPIIDEYDGHVFWDELIERMALRDVLKIHTIEQLEEMSPEDRLNADGKYVAMYEEVFGRLGLDCLKVADEPPVQIEIG